MKYYNIHKKKSKKKKSAADKNSAGILSAIVRVFSFAFCLWLAWALWFGVESPWGKSVSQNLFAAFGQASKLLPVFLIYWLWRIISKKSFAFISIFLGIFLTVMGVAVEVSFLKAVLPQSSLSGGFIGDWFFGQMAGLSGNIGAVLFGLACAFLGVHILFAIPWLATLYKTNDIIRQDFNTWMQARSELKLKVDEAKAEAEKQSPSKTPRRVVADEAANENHISTLEPEQKPLPKIMRPVAGMVKLPPKGEGQMLLTQDSSSESAQSKKPAGEFELPSLDLLNEPKTADLIGPTDLEIAEATSRLEQTLKNFDIAASVTGVAPGPVVTRYEIKPEPGVKISSIVSISNDIALAMKARGIRVEAPIPGKDAIGFEIPNEKALMVSMREILQDKSFINSKYKTTVGLGRYADGLPAVSVLEKMPHLLVAGATNSGKSICVHSIIISLLYRAKPDEIKFMLIDPKRVELTLYEGIPHLYDPKTSCDDVGVIKDAQGAVKSLQALVKVMEKRMRIFEIAKVKNIEMYNAWAAKNNEEKAFYIVVVIDELADLMLQTKAAIEDSVQRLTQMGRALGIHLILCTQRPSTNVITGVIKANLPSRIALQVTSKIDSRVVLDANGADALLGKGDMLYLGISDAKPKRIQGAYVSEEEITKVADFLRAQGGPDYPIQIALEQAQQADNGEGLGTSPEEMIKALTLVKERRRVSQDLLKAQFGSSARATNILSVLEMKGFITKPEGSNRWEIHFELIDQQLDALLKMQQNGGEPSYDTVYK